MIFEHRARMENLNCNVKLNVPFPSEKEATIAYNSLRVDREPLRGNVLKTLSVDGNSLIVEFDGQHAKHVRVSVNTFFDLLILVTKTIDRFGGEPGRKKE